MKIIIPHISLMIFGCCLLSCSSNSKMEDIIKYEYKLGIEPIRKENISDAKQSKFLGSILFSDAYFRIEGAFNKLIIRKPDTITIYDYKKDLFFKIRDKYVSVEFVDSNKFYAYSSQDKLYLNTISGSFINTDSVDYTPFIDRELIEKWASFDGFASSRSGANGKVFYFDNEYIYDNFHKIKIDRATITAQPFGKECDQFFVIGSNFVYSKNDTVYCTNMNGRGYIKKYNINMFLKIKATDNFLLNDQPILIFKKEMDVFPDKLYFYNCATNEFELENEYIKHLGNSFGFINKKYEVKVDSLISINLPRGLWK